MDEFLSDCDISGLSLNTQINPNVPKVRTNCMENEGVTPMDIDVLHNSFKIDNDFVEEMDMDIDTDDFTSRKFNNLEHTDSELKKRNSSQKQAEEHYSRQFLGVANKTKIVPIMLQTKKSQRNNFILILLVSVILILLYLSFIQANINIMSVNSDIQLQNIQKDLLANIHKQKDSVNVIVRSLEKGIIGQKKLKF
ncbi:hypothetical protein NQ314_011488 [Rhamnusium bicolor]|uniref:Uncharacterized protein n=1 Tax=Rhamnusium bicolor TaxID=1586634 RepID=A0AAV8XJ43_9CUCU|nr:hypothetical protein NQ314_011488 [Rhamnusium bicolor]